MGILEHRVYKHQIHIAVCDDENTEIEKMKLFIGKWSAERKIPYILQCFTNGEDLLGSIQNGNFFDILFLDIYMGETSGLTVARRIRQSDTRCNLVFMTNSPEYAIEGYGVRALQYILKPVKAEVIENTLDIAENELEQYQKKSIQIQNKNGNYRFPVSNIIYAESNARIVTVHLNSKGHICYYERLDNFENLCDDRRFLRCHKSYLINLDYVHAIVNTVALLETGEEIPISKNITNVKKIFAAYLADKL